MPEFVWAFRREAPRRISSLDAALADNAADSVAWHARRLRNNALNVGAVRLAEICDVIEQQARVGRLPLTRDLARLLHAEFDTVEVALADYAD